MIPSRFLGRMLVVFAGVLALGCGGRTDPGAARPGPGLPGSAPEAGADPAGPPVTLTPGAAATVRQILAEQGMPGPVYLRLRVVPGGCTGFQHKLDLDPVTSAGDHVFEADGVKVVVPKRQLDMLRGARVDFVSEEGKRGFSVHNPNLEGEALKRWLPVLQQEKPPE